MKLLLPALMLFGLLPLLSSCLVSYGDNTTSSITKDTPTPCKNRSDRVQVFYDGEPLNFRYERIGLVEAKGEKSATNEKVLDFLRHQAWFNCADAVIGVRKGYTQRTEGLLFSSKEQETEYSATVFSGIAVRIVRDSTFLARYPSVADTAFVTRVNAKHKRETRKANQQLTASILLPIIGGVIGVVYLASQDN